MPVYVCGRLLTIAEYASISLVTVNVPHPIHILPILVYVNIPVILSWEVASVVVSNLPFTEKINYRKQLDAT